MILRPLLNLLQFWLARTPVWLQRTNLRLHRHRLNMLPVVVDPAEQASNQHQSLYSHL